MALQSIPKFSKTSTRISRKNNKIETVQHNWFTAGVLTVFSRIGQFVFGCKSISQHNLENCLRHAIYEVKNQDDLTIDDLLTTKIEIENIKSPSGFAEYLSTEKGTKDNRRLTDLSNRIDEKLIGFKVTHQESMQNEINSKNSFNKLDVKKYLSLNLVWNKNVTNETKFLNVSKIIDSGSAKDFTQDTKNHLVLHHMVYKYSQILLGHNTNTGTAENTGADYLEDKGEEVYKCLPDHYKTDEFKEFIISYLSQINSNSISELMFTVVDTKSGAPIEMAYMNSRFMLPSCESQEELELRHVYRLIPKLQELSLEDNEFNNKFTGMIKIFFESLNQQDLWKIDFSTCPNYKTTGIVSGGAAQDLFKISGKESHHELDSRVSKYEDKRNVLRKKLLADGLQADGFTENQKQLFYQAHSMLWFLIKPISSANLVAGDDNFQMANFKMKCDSMKKMF